MDGSCASSCKCQTLRMPRGSETIGLKKQSICLPFLHCGTLGLWLPHGWGFQPWGCWGGAVWCIIYTTLMAARSSAPHKCLYRAPNSAFPQNKPNAMRHISGSGSSLVLVCSCSLYFLSTPGVQEEQLFLFSQFPCPPQGSLCGRSRIQSP